jgi:hypothetical protein
MLGIERFIALPVNDIVKAVIAVTAMAAFLGTAFGSPPFPIILASLSG